MTQSGVLAPGTLLRRGDRDTAPFFIDDEQSPMVAKTGFPINGVEVGSPRGRQEIGFRKPMRFCCDQFDVCVEPVFVVC